MASHHPCQFKTICEQRVARNHSVASCQRVVLQQGFVIAWRGDKMIGAKKDWSMATQHAVQMKLARLDVYWEGDLDV